MGKRKRGSRRDLEKECDRLFSILIRMKHLMHNDRIECYTCGHTYHYREMQCGHYIGRGNHITRWLEDNCRPQCKTCNEYKHGNLEEFKLRLERETPGLPEFLENLKNQTEKHTQSDLTELIFHLKQRIEECGGMKTIPRGD